MKAVHKIGLASLGVIGVAGLLYFLDRMLFTTPSDVVDISKLETPTPQRIELQRPTPTATLIPDIEATIQARVEATISASTPTVIPPELKYDILSIDLKSMLLEEDHIPRVVKDRIFSYRSRIRSDYPVQCEYPILEKNVTHTTDPLIEFLSKSAKLCGNIFLIELNDYDYWVRVGLGAYNSPQDAESAFGSFKISIMDKCATELHGECPKMSRYSVEPSIGEESIAFYNAPARAGGAANYYDLYFRADNVIGYIIGIEPQSRTFLDAESITQMGKLLYSRVKERIQQ